MDCRYPCQSGCRDALEQSAPAAQAKTAMRRSPLGTGEERPMFECPERYNASALLDATSPPAGVTRSRSTAAMSRYPTATSSSGSARWVARCDALGVDREQRVLLVLDDTPAFPVAFFGAMRIGAVPVPVNPLFRVADYRFFLEDTGARVVDRRAGAPGEADAGARRLW